MTLAALPDVVSFADAATLPVAGLTARHAIARAGDVRGKKVLVNEPAAGSELAASWLISPGARRCRHPDENQGDSIRRLGADELSVRSDLRPRIERAIRPDCRVRGRVGPDPRWNACSAAYASCSA